ncbi:MAG TPA: hypothetical protein VGM29_01435 [Polyangiaceae bacterium]
MNPDPIVDAVANHTLPELSDDTLFTDLLNRLEHGSSDARPGRLEVLYEVRRRLRAAEATPRLEAPTLLDDAQAVRSELIRRAPLHNILPLVEAFDRLAQAALREEPQCRR